MDSGIRMASISRQASAMAFARELSVVFLVCALISLKHQSAAINFSDHSMETPSLLQAPPSHRNLQVNGNRQSALPACRRFDYHDKSRPLAEGIVRSAVQDLYEFRPEIAPALRVQDCFEEGCDASVLSDPMAKTDSEKEAPPNESLKGFDMIDIIKLQVEEACPGVVSCADTVVLAARESVHVTGGPFYPLFTGREDGKHASFTKANEDLPGPEDYLNTTLGLFHNKGFNEKETVSSCALKLARPPVRSCSSSGSGNLITGVESDHVSKEIDYGSSDIPASGCSSSSKKSSNDDGDDPGDGKKKILQRTHEIENYKDDDEGSEDDLHGPKKTLKFNKVQSRIPEKLENMKKSKMPQPRKGPREPRRDAGPRKGIGKSSLGPEDYLNTTGFNEKETVSSCALKLARPPVRSCSSSGSGYLITGVESDHDSKEIDYGSSDSPTSGSSSSSSSSNDDGDDPGDGKKINLLRTHEVEYYKDDDESSEDDLHEPKETVKFNKVQSRILERLENMKKSRKPQPRKGPREPRRDGCPRKGVGKSSSGPRP